jgi:ABC-type multidrug transport system fused ATPase/permease subunit
LDDPLSAVDAPTARFLLHKCIMGLLKGRTVILVSHATNLVIPFADLVVVMKNGEIAASGPPIEITNSVEDETVFGISLEKDIFDDEKEGFSTDDGQIAATIAGGGTGLIKKEEQTTGSVSPKLYRKYFAATGGFGFLLLFFGGFILASASNFGKNWWLHVWTDANNANIGLHTFGIPNFSPEYTFSEMQNPIQPLIQRPFPTNSIFESEPTQNGQLFYIGVYALFGLLFILATTVRTIVRLVGSLWASRKLHDELLKSILYSPLRFFEVTPVGRILNRFSSDIEKIDVQVLQAVAIFSNQVIQGVTIIVIIGSMAPTFLLMVPFITFFFLKVAKLYLYSSRELKRIESTSRSPIYSQFSETLAGVCTIRAYGAEERFQNLNLFKVDQNTKPYFLMWATNRWLSIRTDFLSNIVVMGAGCAIIFGELGPGWAALVLTYAMQFTNALVWTIRFHAEMEMAMNSVERVQEYCEIDQEPPAIIESNRPSSEWPQHGAIQVRDLSIRYAEDLPDVLQGVSFEVLANEKVAVVGRTGAGKSTLSLAFFRIISLSGGSITIDGENISNLGLHDLRSKLTIIPQDPVLFTGDLRSNLDPFDQHDEPKIWEALKGVHFLESLQQKKANDPQSLTEGEAASVIDPNTITLDYKVQENGGNFSQGQRQLLCLARSLLQGNKIIFLDEATASVDNDTDAKIQATIRTEFADRTIICIAHKLRTIIDYDKVLVLDKGKVIEFGTPLNLIEQNGTFRSMCEDTGEFQELVELAKNGSANGFNK